MIKLYYTENSIYEMDEAGGRYRRSPRFDPRPITSHRLVYDEWLPLAGYEVLNDGWEDQFLHIMAPDSVYGITTSRLTYPEEMS